MNDHLPQCIAFDAVGTLITPMPSVADIYWQVGNRYASRYSIAELRERFRHAFSQPSHDDELHTKLEAGEVIDSSFMSILNWYMFFILWPQHISLLMSNLIFFLQF